MILRVPAALRSLIDPDCASRSQVPDAEMETGVAAAEWDSDMEEDDDESDDDEAEAACRVARVCGSRARIILGERVAA